MLSVLIIVVTSLILFLILRSKTKYSKQINKFPGPKTIPIFGNSLNLSREPELMFTRLRGFCRKYSSYRLWAGDIGTIHLVTPEDIENILTSSKNITKGFIYDFLHPWLGTGLLTSTGNKWQKRRKILTPAFHFTILRKFVEIIIENSESIVSDLRPEIKNDKTDIIPYITQSTLNVICETAMGTKLRSTDKKDKTYIDAVHGVGKLIMYRILSPWFYNDFIFNIIPVGWKQTKFLKTLHNFTTNVITEREKNFKDSDVEHLDEDLDDGIQTKKRLAMLDLLIKEKRSKNDIDNEGIREEVDTFMFEGHDTTSMALSFALMLLANHADVQDKIVAELEEIFAHTERKTTFQDLQNMRYLEMCIKECLRLYPSVPVISRNITQDLQLSQFVAPAGSTVLVHIYDVHRDAKHFPDPEKFDPERFLPENIRGRHPFAYVPFSAGPRNCIGQKFAILEMKSIVSAILWNYKLEPIHTPDDIHIIMDIVLRNNGPIYMKLTPRVHEEIQ